MTRPDWDTYFAQLTLSIATRATCIRAQHGALIVRDHRIVATGYNGAPPGLPHCDEQGLCYRIVHNIPSGQQYEKCKSLHAEQNALLQCAKYGIPVAGASIYITDQPCELCAKQIFASGIIEVIILAESGRYCTKALHDFQEAGYVVRYLKEPT